MQRHLESSDSIRSNVYIRENFPQFWEKGQIIGSGSFGRVFKVIDKSTSSEEQFVVKELPLDTARKTKVWNTFKLETEILFLLKDHKRIVPFYGYSIQEDFAYIFMGYMSEGSLVNLYQDNAVHEEKCFYFVSQILQGLAYLHDQGIIHRDIKGANILLERGHNIRLTDFGISKIVTQTTADFTEQKGSCRWMAPEVCNPPKTDPKYCFKSDIWSVGCTVVEVLTRDLPYHDCDNEVAIMFKVGFAEPPEFPNNVSERMTEFLLETFKVQSERKSAKILMGQFFQNQDLQEQEEENNPVRPVMTETKVSLLEQECTKNEGHVCFKDIDNLTKEHLPPQHQDDKTFDLVKTVCGLTVKLEVNEISQHRPDTWPDSSVPYPKYDQGNIPKTRCGTGMIYSVATYKEDNGRCPCQKCLLLSEPTKTWGVIEVMTAAHVVFDSSEARSTKCILFYDNNESEEIILEGFQLVYVDIGKNLCRIQCYTCDLHLLNKVTILLDNFETLCKQHILSEGADKFGFIVSHPHGGPKQISSGKLLDIKVINKTWSQYIYDIPTCPGSSGAYVHIFGESGKVWHYPHLHSGITSNGRNCSSTGYYASDQLVCLETRMFQNVKKTSMENRNTLETLTDQFLSASAIPMKEKILLKNEKVLHQDELTMLNKFKNLKEIVEYCGSRIEDNKIIAAFFYMPMGSLETYYQNNGPPTEEKCCLYVRQILTGLQFLHDEHVIHMNITGKHILLESESHIRICGLEKSKCEPQFTKSAQDLNVRWTAPETINEKFGLGTYGVKVDIWSLGCTIVELITGDVPYIEMKTTEVIFETGKGKPPEFKKEIKMELTNFMDKCFHAEPTDRFSASLLLDDPWILSSAAIDVNDQPSFGAQYFSELIVMADKTRKLKVEGNLCDITRDQLRIFFKNKRGQGGGPVEDIHKSEDNTSAVITFKEHEAVDLIMNRGNTVKISGIAVKVSPLVEGTVIDIPASPDKSNAQKSETASVVEKTNKLRVEGLSEEITKDQLNICFKNKRSQGGWPIEDIQISEDKTTAVITFKETEAVDLIMARGVSVKISGRDLKVSPLIEKPVLEVSKVILNSSQMPASPEKKSSVKSKSAGLGKKTKLLKVKGLSGEITKDLLRIFFKNKRGQGGGSVEDVRLGDDNHKAFITFKKPEAVDLIMSRGDSVTMSNAVIKVKPYYEETNERKTETQTYSSDESQEEPQLPSKPDKRRSKSENKSLDKKIEATTTKVKSKTKSKEQPQAITKKPEREKPKPPKKTVFKMKDNVDSESEDEEQDTNLLNKTVKITFSCLKERREDYIFFLEDPELNIGEFYEESLMLDGLHNILYMTFHTAKAARDFCRLNHPPDMNISCVNMATEDDFKTYPNYIYLNGMLGELEELEQQIVDKTNFEVMDIIQHDEPNTCIVIFHPEVCSDITHLTWELTCLDDKKLVTAPVYKTNSILVSGLTPNVNIATLKRYLENNKRSGGGKVKSLNKISDDQIVVHFEEDVDLDNLLSREDHKINDAELELIIHYPCLSKDYLIESSEHKQSVATEPVLLTAYPKGKQLKQSVATKPVLLTASPKGKQLKQSVVTEPVLLTASPKGKQLAIIPSLLFSSKHTIKMEEDTKFIGTLDLTKETFHFLKRDEQDLVDIVLDTHCSMEILPKKLRLKLNFTMKVTAKEVKRMIESGFEKLYHFLHQFTVVKFQMEDSEIYEFQTYCGGKITDIYFDHESNEVTVISSKSLKDLEALVHNLYTEFLQEKKDGGSITNTQKPKPPMKGKQPAKDESTPQFTFKHSGSSKPVIPVQQKTFQYSNDIKLERYEFMLLLKSKYFDQLKENYKQTNLNLDSDTQNVVLRGNDESQINTILFEILNKCRQDVSCKKVDNLTPDQLELLKKENVQKKIDSILENCCLHCNDTDAKLYYITTGSCNVDDAIKKVKSQVESHKKKLNPEMLSLLQSTEGAKFLSSLKENSNDVSLVIKFDSNNDLLIIAPIDQVYSLTKSIDTFLEKNKLYSKDVPISSGKQEFLKKYLMKEYNQIKSTLGRDASVELISDKCIIKGLKDSVGHGEKLVKELVSQIDINNVTLKYFGIEEYLHDNEGKNLLRSIEHSNRCIIQLESDTPKDAKPKVPSKLPVMCAKTSINGVNIVFFQGNIFGLKADAVVNPLDSTMQFVSAMNKELINQGGLAIKNELESSRQSSSVGSVIETSSGSLSNVKKIVHVVCPMYCDHEQLKDLGSAMRACLQHVVDQNYTSIGLPVIGLGKILKFPLLPACQQIVQAIKSCLDSKTNKLTDIYVCDVKAKNIQEIMDRCETYFENVSLESISEPKDTKGSFKVPSPLPSKSFTKKGWDFKNIKVTLTPGEVNKQDTDIIVITVDKSLDLSKGILAKTILREAGDGIQNELLNRFTDGIRPGEFAESGGGNLPCKHIFHACLSRFRGDNAQMEALVYKLLEGADKIQANSISIPALGTGNLGYPSDIAAEVIMGTIEKYAAKNSNSRLQVCLVVFPKDQEVADIFKTVLSTGGRGATGVDHSEQGESGRSAADDLPKVHVSEEVKLKIYSDSAQERTLAEKKLKESCKSVFKEEKEKEDNLQRLSKTRIKQLQHIGNRHRIKVTVRAEEHLIIMQGFSSDGMLKVHKMLKNVVMEAVEQHHKSLLHAMPVSIEWQYMQGDKWRGFGSTLNSEIEREHKTKANKHEVTDHNGRKIEIDFVNMKEIFHDEKSGKKSTFEIRRFDKTKTGEPLPKKWDKMSPTENLKIIQVQPGTTEFKKVEQHFRTKGANFPIKKIERIQNKSLYQQYSVKKRDMDLHNPKGLKNETKLFHGTSAGPIPQINENGFNRSYCGVNGTAYGKGVYFAAHSSYSVGYAKADLQGNRHMYTVKVLTGENTPTNSGTHFLPNKPGTNRPYDSGGDPNQGIYVIFHDAQVYPEYLITF